MKKIVLIIIAVLVIGAIGVFAFTSNQPIVVATPNLDKLGEESTNEEIIQAATADYQAQKYSQDNPFIVTDLFGKNKLSAYVAFPINEESTYSYTVAGKDKYSDFTMSSEVAQADNMIIPIIGLYENYNNEVTITIKDESGKENDITVNIQTGELAENFIPNLDMDTSYSDIETASESLQDGLIWTAMGNGYDVNGEIRVALGQKGVQTANPISLNDDGSYLQMYYDKVESIDFTGRVLTTYEMPEGYEPHHDQMSAENGYTYILTTPNVKYEEGKDNYNDGHIAVYKTGVSGLPVKEFDLNTDFIGNQVNDAGTIQDAGTDLMHLNSVDYYQPTNSIIVSSQTMNLLAAFNADTFELQWTTADPAGQGDNASKSKALTQLDSYVPSNGQHNSHVTENPLWDDGDESTIEIQLFDNEYCVDENGDTIFHELDTTIGDRKECESPDSEILVYRIDTKNKTVDTIYQSKLEGQRSSTQASWFQSPDYKYNTITYTQTGTIFVTDAENNIIFSASNPEGTDPMTYSTYRGRVLNNQQLASNFTYVSENYN